MIMANTDPMQPDHNKMISNCEVIIFDITADDMKTDQFFCRLRFSVQACKHIGNDFATQLLFSMENDKNGSP